MLPKLTPAIFLTATLTTDVAIAPSLAQTLNPAEPILSQTTAADCPSDIAGCPVRGDYFTWTPEPIPYRLSPRHGKILAGQPLLRWLPVAGATSYTVTLDGPGVAWQADNVTATAIQYDGDPLQPGAAYQWSVVADTGADSWDEPAHRGGVGDRIVVMTVAEQLAVEADVAQLRETLADPDMLRLALADLYLQYGLIADGIAELETLWQQQPTAALAVRLGNLYFDQLLLVEPSETYFRQALELWAEPPLVWAEALVQLGHLQIVKQDYGAAIAFWQEAQDLYNAMGQPQAAAALKVEIERWLPKVEP